MNIQTILLTSLGLWNSIVFVLYARDKRLARKKRYRISEKTLLLSSLLGGGLGATLAGVICHHKTRKWYFWLSWILGLILDTLVIYMIWRR